MLEEKAGLSTGLDRKVKCVPLHGSLHFLRCPLCCTRRDWHEHEASIDAGEGLPCNAPSETVTEWLQEGEPYL